MHFFDARPLINAQANRAGGGGFEAVERYCGGASVLVFLDIANIHVVRKALSRLRSALLRAQWRELHASARGGDEGGTEGRLALGIGNMTTSGKEIDEDRTRTGSIGMPWSRSWSRSTAEAGATSGVGVRPGSASFSTPVDQGGVHATSVAMAQPGMMRSQSAYEGFSNHGASHGSDPWPGPGVVF